MLARLNYQSIHSSIRIYIILKLIFNLKKKMPSHFKTFNNWNDTLFGKAFVRLLIKILNNKEDDNEQILSYFENHNVRNPQKYFVKIFFKKLSRISSRGHRKKSIWVTRFFEIKNISNFIKFIKNQDVIYILFIDKIISHNGTRMVNGLKLYKYCHFVINKTNVKNVVINQNNWNDEVEDEFNFHFNTV